VWSTLDLRYKVSHEALRDGTFGRSMRSVVFSHDHHHHHLALADARETRAEPRVSVSLWAVTIDTDRPLITSVDLHHTGAVASTAADNSWSKGHLPPFWRAMIRPPPTNSNSPSSSLTPIPYQPHCLTLAFVVSRYYSSRDNEYCSILLPFVSRER